MLKTNSSLWWIPILLFFVSISLFTSQKNVNVARSSLENITHDELSSTTTLGTITSSSFSNETIMPVQPIGISSQDHAVKSQHNIHPRNNNNNNNNKITSSPYAYVFMVWRLDPSKPQYLGYIANILIATKLLRMHGSKADIVAIFKVKYESSHTQLPENIENMFSKLNIRIQYIPKEDDGGVNVYGSMFTKFYVFRMTQYRRVLYLDSDVLPINNLDYLMELSDNGMLKENIILASNREPSNGGFMLVKPNEAVYHDIQQLVKLKGKDLGRNEGFDPVQGWGQTIEKPDQWETNLRQNSGRLWKFWAANADQGFLYYNCKYVLKSCTQVLARKVTNFGPGPNGTTTVIEKEWKVQRANDSPLFNYTHRKYRFYPANCGKFTGYAQNSGWPGCVPPYVDQHHFTGKSKPWLQPYPVSRRSEPKSTSHLWWHTLSALRDEDGINMTLLDLKPPY